MTKDGDSMKALRMEIEEISDADDRSISECMVVVISAAKVGADVDRLVEYTGLRRDLIEVISHRMRAARLWVDELVDYREWRENASTTLAAILINVQACFQYPIARSPMLPIVNPQREITSVERLASSAHAY